MAKDWNRVWQERRQEPLQFDSWLQKVLPLMPPSGRLLDIACGRGRNALPLAARGYHVTAVDSSPQGLKQLAAEAARQQLPVTTVQQDLEHNPHLNLGTFDIVLQFFYLQRSLFDSLRQTVKPGGLAVVRTFSRAGEAAGGPGNPDYVLLPGELPVVFAGWEILLHEEGQDRAQRGGCLAGIVARKPPSADREAGPCA